jgi:hypothetical protein
MAITTAARDQLVALTVVMFKAAPGKEYLNELIALYESGASLPQIASGLAASALAKPLFEQVNPPQRSMEQTINIMAADLLPASTPAAAVAEAKAFVTTLLESGQSLASVLQQAMQALWGMANSDVNFGAAKQQLLNRVAVANYYSVEKALPSGTVGQLQGVLAGVTDNPASVTTAINNIDISGQRFELTTGVDNFVGGSGADVFNARALALDGSVGTTFSPSDQLDGKDGIDTLNITPNGLNNTGFPAGASVKKIEIINIQGAFGDVDASKFQGAAQINLSGLTGGIEAVINNLGADVTASFGDIPRGSNLYVNLASNAASATVELNNVQGRNGEFIGIASTVYISPSATGTLDSVTLRGSVAEGAGDDVDPIWLFIPINDQASPELRLDVDTAMPIVLQMLTIESNPIRVDASASSGNIIFSSNFSPAADELRLGTGQDHINIDSPVVLAADGKSILGVDSIYNLNLARDTLSLFLPPALGGSAAKLISVTGNNLTDALNAAALNTDWKVVFTYGGDAYVYADRGADNQLDAEDLLVKLVGINSAADLDALVAML